MRFFGLFKSQEEKELRKSEAHDLTNGLQNHITEPNETFEEKNQKRLKRISKFVIIMLFYSVIFTPTPTHLYPGTTQIKINDNASHPHRRHPLRLSRVQPP
jgi:hypothetical protein